MKSATQFSLFLKVSLCNSIIYLQDEVHDHGNQFAGTQATRNAIGFANDCFQKVTDLVDRVLHKICCQLKQVAEIAWNTDAPQLRDKVKVELITLYQAACQVFNAFRIAQFAGLAECPHLRFRATALNFRVFAAIVGDLTA